MSDSSVKASRRFSSVVRILLWTLVVAVLYPISVAALVSAYWLKTDYGYNMLKEGGWHAFSKCLVEQIPVTTPRITDSTPR